MADIPNPYAKPKRTTVVVVPKKSKPRYGAAQAEFIRNTRKSIKEDPSILMGMDWRRIPYSSNHLSLASKKKISVNDFYVKDYAVWLPHAIIPHYIPTCYRCGRKEGVDPTRFRWVPHPKILHGVRSHRYLDSVYYSCTPCGGLNGGEFTAWNEKTMSLDAKEITGVLNFRLSKGFVVDDELHSFVVALSNDATASTYQRLKDLHADHWVNLSTIYHRAILAKRINVVPKRGRMDVLFESRGPETQAQKRRKSLRWEHTKLERQVQSTQSSFDVDISFVNTSRRKENRNSIGEIFPGIGKGKCETLVRNGIRTARQLLDFEIGDNPSISKHSWQRIVQDHYDNIEGELEYLKSRRDAAKTELDLDVSIFGDVSRSENNNENNNNNNTGNDAEKEADAEEKPPLFSSLDDPTKYNCRVVSKQTINRINMTDFQRQKPLQEAKMRVIKARVWKIDWHYKLPKKIKVYTGKGKCFAPYKSGLSIQNEDALTTFWKFYPGAESIDMAKRDLKLLKKRNDLLGETLEVCYVDNCCNVRGKLQKIVGPVLVKLDTFHWQERFDDMLSDKTSEKTAIFRTLMRRAVFITEPSEFQRAKDVLLSQNKKATTRAMLKEAKATIPPPDLLERRVLAVLHSLMEKDLEADKSRIANQAVAKESRFFKPGAVTLNTMLNQMEHIKKGCLSDPSDEVVSLFRHNKRTKKTFTARGTGTNEIDNRYLNRLLDTPSVGLTRADRILHDCYERSNDRKLVNRLGQEPRVTSRSEQVGMLKALAKECGFDDFPEKNPEHPNNVDSLDEKIGFEYQLPAETDDNSDAESEEDSEEPYDTDTEDMIDLLQEAVVENDADEERNEVDVMDLDTTDLEPNDVFGFQANVDVSLYEPTVLQNERTYDTFVRKTQSAQWVPFAHPKDSAFFTAKDVAEYKLFEEMSVAYERNCGRGLDSSKGYKTFARAWDLHVFNLCRAAINGSDDEMINRKSYVQLQNHYDNLQKQKEYQSMSTEIGNLTEVENVFRTTRRAMLPHQSAATELPIHQHNPQLGTPQFGVPSALNTSVAIGAFQRNLQPTGPAIAFRSLLPPPLKPPPTKGALGKNFKGNRYCWRCGFQKKLHSRSNTPFGDKCAGNCGYEQCSKCNNRLADYHENGYVGPHCPNETAPQLQETVSDWWKPVATTAI